MPKKAKGHSKKKRWGGIGKRYRPARPLTKKDVKMSRRRELVEKKRELVCTNGHPAQWLHLNSIGNMVMTCRSLCGTIYRSTTSTA